MSISPRRIATVERKMTRTLRRYLQDYEEALTAYAWIGARQKEEAQYIRDKYHAAKRRLYLYVTGLEEKAYE